MDEISWVNLTLLVASIPDLENDNDGEKEIDTNNWQQYQNR